MQPSLFDLPAPEEPVRSDRPADQSARDFATDPRNDVVLEASAGTGKTTVLVDRYVNLIENGVEPQHILAMTFTRKAAAEMRQRVLDTLRFRADREARMAERWLKIRERIAEIEISTIDAFCFSLLREFPLEANVDPGFAIADETEMARFQNEALDLTFRAARPLVVSDESVRLLFTRVKLPALRDVLLTLVDRRHVSQAAVGSFVKRKVRVKNAADAANGFLERIRRAFDGSPDHRAVVDDGPMAAPEFRWLQRDLTQLDRFQADDVRVIQQLHRRLERYFLTKDRKPRKKLSAPFTADAFASPAAKKRHEAALQALAPRIFEALEALDVDVGGLLARGLQRVLAIAIERYEALLTEHAVLDFAGMLEKAVALLSRQEDFARSRLKLQSRYHHVLVDEFQDTSRLQWRLVDLLIDAWREGEGPDDGATSIFIVGDRKQSIYRFRHAEVTLLDEAAKKIAALRQGRDARRAITHSFRAVPELLTFVNALSDSLQSGLTIDERFSYGESDRFPIGDVAPGARRDGEPVLGLIAEPTMDACAAAVASEVQRLIGTALVRGKEGIRPAEAGDIHILFRARPGHQYFERALEARGIRTYVYKGLGFFDAPEVQDLQALLRYLAQPESDLRAAEFLRSRLVRLSDIGLTRVAPALAAALRAPVFDIDATGLDDVDAPLLARARASVARWLALADRVTPSDLVDVVLRESAYAFELRGRRRDQARENVKKVRALIRRVENRGYATLGRIADHFETLRTGDESNAVIDAEGCVQLMTIHAAKGTEAPIVFVVNIHAPGRGRSSAISVIEQGVDGEADVAFGSSESTKLEDQREDEELRRLLYVAVTRARDRLYFAGEVDASNRLRRGARSLGGLLPQSLRDVFGSAAASDAPEVTWLSIHGEFAFRVARPAPVVADLGAPPIDDLRAEVDLEPVSVPVAVTVASAFAGAAAEASRSADSSASSGRLIGTIVHRLFQRRPRLERSVDEVRAIAATLVRGAQERMQVDDPEEVASSAAALYVRLRTRDDVVALLARGVCHYEVPFSFRAAERPSEIVRGSIDCVVDGLDGCVTVVEFKTGAPRPSHDAQVAIYARALRAIWPDRVIESNIVYP